jgi:hypothetical protein
MGEEVLFGKQYCKMVIVVEVRFRSTPVGSVLSFL